MDYIFVKSGKEIIKVKLDTISHIEALSNYVKIYVEDSAHIVYQSMATLIDKLPDQFMRVHNSYIVNINHLDRIINNTLLIGSHKIPLSKSYRVCFKDRIDKNLL